MKKLISQFVVVATAGKTIDGREITTEQIDQMAASYDPKKYGARIWLEHFRSVYPESSFKAYGDVIAVKAENDKEGNRVLLAQLSPTDDLVKINKDRQKVFTSIEINPNFQGNGTAYLDGLAVTDSPASVGTQMLVFSRKNPEEFAGTTLMDRDYSAYLEVDNLTFSEQPFEPKLLDTVRAIFKKSEQKSDQDFSEVSAAVIEIAESQEQNFTELSASNDALKTSLNTITSDFNDLKKAHDELVAKLDKTPGSDYVARPEDDGSNTETETDC